MLACVCVCVFYVGLLGLEEVGGVGSRFWECLNLCPSYIFLFVVLCQKVEVSKSCYVSLLCIATFFILFFLCRLSLLKCFAVVLHLQQQECRRT